MNSEHNDRRIPVTVITGFLGSGKTTLLNHLLTGEHGKRIAVIENEFGEISIDQELVIGVQDGMFELSNGCICCTVRGDLIRILTNLVKRQDRLDHILIETTGLADPGPVAQSFFWTDEIQDNLRLDSIVTLVDARHLDIHLNESREAREQVAFADIILVNKTDLVTEEELSELEARLKGINGVATFIRTRQAVVDLDAVLKVGGFSLERALQINPHFMDPDNPFQWGGVYALESGQYQWLARRLEVFSMAGFLTFVPEASPGALEEALDRALLARGEGETPVLPDGPIPVDRRMLFEFRRSGQPTAFRLDIPIAGHYALLLELNPQTLKADLLKDDCSVPPVLAVEYHHEHRHSEEVTSVGISTPGDLDARKLEAWIKRLLQVAGKNIFRMKGVLSIAGRPDRYVLQGVHSFYYLTPSRPWNGERRQNSVVFIGRNLDRGILNRSFLDCLANPEK
jgi:G3E family GTPase